MDALDVLRDLARRPLDSVEAVTDRLTPHALNAHPDGHDNSIAWLLWHTAREIDVQIADLSGREPVWTSQGFDTRFRLGTAPGDLGFGHTAEQARSVVVEDAALLVEHLGAAVDAFVAYLDTLDANSLDDVIDESWTPPVTRGARLVSIANDAFAHVSQVEYVLGTDTLTKEAA